MYAYGLPLNSEGSTLILAILRHMGLDDRQYFGAMASIVTALLLSMGGWKKLRCISEGRPLPKSIRRQMDWNLARKTPDRPTSLPFPDEEFVDRVLADIQAALVASGFSVSRRTPGL